MRTSSGELCGDFTVYFKVNHLVFIVFTDKLKMKGFLFPGGNHPTAIVEGVGMFLFAAYHVAVIIVLINMLIAMMSHSFEDIQVTTHSLFNRNCEPFFID